MIKLGYRVRDIITGFEGIATARVEYLNGCVQYCVKPPMKDGKQVESEYFDHQQLQAVDAGVSAQIAANATGGPSPFTPPTSYRG
jgi:hypothetical protein